MIDKHSPMPIYYQIEEAIKERIDKGEWREGDMIPSEREFSEMYHISRMTVRQAVTNLVSDGYLIRQIGRGTFVARRKIQQKLFGLTSFTEDMKGRGMKPGTRLLDFRTVSASGPIAEQLQIPDGGEMYEIKRVRSADDLPMALEITYLSEDLVRGLTEEDVYGSLYGYVEKELGMTIGYATQELESSVAREAESRTLGIAEGAPLLLIKRFSYLEDETPLEIVYSAYRGDRYKFVVGMHRNRTDSNG
ncbi:GntR family transcriptional regulator [Paludifilum halophilum]|uniref:Phosphonate metabolism transcriptional regulator PhnF n=1 Tax=Paludifilum halophilum TaxID=1642702 RepID=A0A235B4G9_9BACL|nr:GntR family transcriptional regulator [Paludifilum halophilum]OYD06797.1 phosphonate metabolism transcriptional regulator PhnF [Paludifilum halophilum]